MPEVTVKLSDGVREITVEYSGTDHDPLARAEEAAIRLYGIVAGAPHDRRAGFGGWAISSDTERSPDE